MLTEKEQEYLIAMTKGDYGDCLEGEPTYFWDVYTGFDGRVKGGVASSLVKKGYIVCDGKGDERIVKFTEAGLTIVKRLLAPQEEVPTIEEEIETIEEPSKFEQAKEIIQIYGYEEKKRDTISYRLDFQTLETSFIYNTKTNRICVMFQENLDFMICDDKIFEVFDILSEKYCDVFSYKLEKMILAFDNFWKYLEQKC